MRLTVWAQALRASLLAIGMVLGVSWIAAQVGKAVEGDTARHAMLFDKLWLNLVVVTLAALPLLFLGVRLGLLERIHSIRFKLFTAYLVGQVAALVATYVAANNSRAMPFDVPNDGLVAVLLVYAAMMSLALAYLLAGSLTAALGRIRAGAARIADGDLETRIDTTARDELGELAADLNAMAARLTVMAQQERRVEQSRRELIAAVSHDLRTPLSAIQATVEAITDGVVTDAETIARYLRTIHAATRELSALIDDLFELSRIETGALRLAPELIVVDDVIREALERLQPRADARGVALRGHVEDALPPAHLDARHIGRVLANLVDNALRHTPAGGCVDVVASRRDGVTRVEVSDTGEGIAAEDLPHIFERFYRGEKSRSREHGGAGLGLAISKGIVEAHGGMIWADPVYPHGVRVTFTLPRDAT